jgi:hypothetical protein
MRPLCTILSLGIVVLCAQATGCLAAARTDCVQAAQNAERTWGLPEHLLLAIGNVETGQWDATRRRLKPIPYSINVNGTGVTFSSQPYALGTVTALQSHGIRSIDVGCFQVNLFYHPTAFASVADAFDADANANYAAMFLTRLFGEYRSWHLAIAAYHSLNPIEGGRYRDHVLREWQSLSNDGHRGDGSRRIDDHIDDHIDRHVILISAKLSTIPVYTPATLPASLRASLAPLITH